MTVTPRRLRRPQARRYDGAGDWYYRRAGDQYLLANHKAIEAELNA